MAQRTAQVTIDNATVQRMLNDERFLQAFPFLRAIKLVATRGRKSCCGRKRRLNVSQPNFEAARHKLATMEPRMKTKLKTLLDTEQVQIRYTRVAGGKILKRF